MTKTSIATLLAVTLTLTAIPGYAEDDSSKQEVTSDAVVADLLLKRPAGLAATVVGTAIFIVGLPFTLLNGSTGQAAQKLIVEPAQYTFTRPLGKG